jgi:ComF family protein
MERLVGDGDAIIVPVPLHRWRIWRRGYNQSALIARVLARRDGLVLGIDLLNRKRATPVLRGLGRNARAKAVRGAFVVDPARRKTLKGRQVLLVDDVHTTGATANACARALKSAGAAEVRLVCWARVDLDGSGDVDN